MEYLAVADDQRRADVVLEMQRTAGNRAVARMIQRAETAPGADEHAAAEILPGDEAATRTDVEFLGGVGTRFLGRETDAEVEDGDAPDIVVDSVEELPLDLASPASPDAPDAAAEEGPELVSAAIVARETATASPPATSTSTSANAIARRDYVFIMGTDKKKSTNKFYLSARKHFSAKLPAAQIIDSERSLAGVFAMLRTITSASAPAGNIYVVSHANQDGTLPFPIEDGDTEAETTYSGLRDALKTRSQVFRLTGGVDAKTTIHIRGCNIGRNEGMLNALDEAFGGDVTVTAPTHRQMYTWSQNGATATTDEFFNGYVVERAGDVSLDKADQVAAFEAKYIDLNLGTAKWRALVGKKGAARLLDRKCTFTVRNASSLTDAEVIAAAEASYDPRVELGRPGSYTWSVARSGKGKAQKAVATLDLTIYHIDKDISDTVGHVHPAESENLYYGTSTYAPPPGTPTP